MDRFEDAKLRIKEATDLVALIESYMPLKPRGRSMLALCPFHAEKSPSFTVYPDTQHYHCFGCGKSGDVFNWLQERDGLSFREAVEVLADRAGISRGMLQRLEKGDLKCEIGAAFEVATIVGVRLFEADGAALSRHLSRTEDKLALLPKSVRKKSRVVRDDF